MKLNWELSIGAGVMLAVKSVRIRLLPWFSGFDNRNAEKSVRSRLGLLGIGIMPRSRIAYRGKCAAICHVPWPVKSGAMTARRSERYCLC